MKRVILAALIALLAVCFTAPAYAEVEVNMRGRWEQALQWADNLNFFESDTDQVSEDDFRAYQRVRFYWEAVASENLRGVFGLQSTFDFGDNAGANQSSLGADAVDIAREDTYIEFNWPDTALRFRTGFWYLEPPANFGSPVWNDDVAGISASYAFTDMVSATLFWARLLDVNVGGETGGQGDGSAADEIDAFGLIVPIAADGFNLTPYLIYAAHGNGTTGAVPAVGGLTSNNATQIDDDLSIWWGGASFNMNMFDPFVFYADLIYGTVDGAQERNDRSGWWFDFAVDYKMDMLTPRLFFAWGSGDDDDPNDGSERMPTLGGEGCGCGLTSLGFDGSAGWRTADATLIGNGYGLWTLGVSLLDISFIDSVTHTLTIAYGQGTNDSDLIKNARAGNEAWYVAYFAPATMGGYAGYLTDDDSFWEIDFNTRYQMYENLVAFLEFGYLNLNLDDDVWGNVGDQAEAASKLAFILQYSF